jgi:DNA-binding CsgD family transcriptional regulator/tetratricopeptide (TPR) repeat protein
MEGAAGIGKTRLATEIARVVMGEGGTFLVGRAEQSSRGRPFDAFVKALGVEATSTTLTRRRLAELLRPEPGGAPRQAAGLADVGFHISDLIVEMVHAAAMSAPLLVVLDDLQWADEGTLDTLAILRRSLSTDRILVLASARPLERAALTRGAWAQVRTMADQIIDLSPLSSPDIRTLVAGRLGAEPGSRLLHVAARAGGNPFFVCELVDVLEERNLLGPRNSAEGTAEVEIGRIDDPELLALVSPRVLAGLAHVAPETIELLQLASVLGRSFRPSLLADVAGRSSIAISASLIGAVDAGLLRDAGDELTFRHDLVRDALYDSVPEPIRHGWHRDVARILIGGGALAQEIASHLAPGARPGDDEVVGYLVRAADEVEQAAPTTAVTWLEQALGLVARSDKRRADIIGRLVANYLHAGRSQAARDVANRELERDPNSRLAYQLRTSLAQLAFLEGALVKAGTEMELLGRAPAGTHAERGLALADAAMAAVLTGDLDRGRRLAEDAVAETDDAKVVVYSLEVRALATGLEGDLHGAIDLAVAGVEQAERADDPHAFLNHPHLLLAQVQLWAGRHEDARRSMHDGRAVSARLGLGWDAPLYQAVAAELQLEMGEWDDAIAEIEAGLSYADDLGTHLLDGLARSRLAEIQLARGDLERARTLVGEGLADMERSGGQGADLLFRVHALIQEADGDVEGATRTLEAVWDRLVELSVALRQWELAPDLCRLSLLARRRPLAEAVIAHLAGLATRFGHARAATTHLWCLGMVRNDTDALMAAEQDLAAQATPIRLALLRADLARVLGDVGPQTEAARYVELAAETFGQVGAAQTLLRHDLHPAGTGPRATERFGWDSLTRSERRVVELLGDGLTNAEIAERLSISRRTVESHLYHVYPKLGLSSRVELAIEVSHRFGRSPEGEPPANR